MNWTILDVYNVSYNQDTGYISITSNTKHKKGKEMTIFNRNGYLYVKLKNKAYPIHDIITSKFLGTKNKGLTVNHIDGNKLNNKLSNLEYLTISENVKHAVKNGLHVCRDVTKMPKYKDGRCKDLDNYKREWYLKNKERILNKLKEKYHAKQN